MWLSRVVERALRSVLLRLTDNRPVSALAGTSARVATVMAAVFVSLGLLNLDRTVTSLLAGVDVIGIALGFAFQHIAANFMSGVITTLQSPFDVGDLVEVGGRLGKIHSIELRATEIDTLDGLSVLIPNKDVFQHAIINYTKTPARRMEIAFGTSYANDMERVREVCLAALQGVPHRDREKEPELFFKDFADSSINLVVRFWLDAADQTTWLDARSEALIAIKKAFDREKITIPFPIRTLDFGARKVGGVRLDDMMLKLTDDSTPAEDAPAPPPSSTGS